MTIIWCMVPEIWSVTDTIFCHFGPFFALYLFCPFTVPEIWWVTDVIVIFQFGLFFALFSLTAQKIKILKKWKKGLEVSSFYIGVPKITIRWCTVPEIWSMTDRQMDRWTDGQKKQHIEVGAPPKNFILILNAFE